jgi:putative PIN family toxin of toxin-antitoxin system
MGKKKIVIDTNNLISALGWKGNPRKLLEPIKILDELKRVMDYPKFKFTDEQKNKFLQILSEISTIIETKIKLNITEDPDDNMFIECALESGADYIISGDGHLKKIEQFKNIKIISVSDFLKENK